MGVIVSCCTGNSEIQNSSISVYTLSGIEPINNNDLYKDEIPNITDLNQAYTFITSKDYYPLLCKKIPKHIISKKICLKLNNTDIMTLINNLFEWIRKEEFYDCDDTAKKNINFIKENTKMSLNYILKELKDNKFNNDKINIFMLQSLTHMSIIVQCILFLVNNKNKESNIYNSCIWDNKNIIHEAKINAFQAAYFLLLTKNKNNKDTNLENKITNEKKEEIKDYYKVSLNFAYDLINS
jgi:hypothetical protein